MQTNQQSERKFCNSRSWYQRSPAFQLNILIFFLTMNDAEERDEDALQLQEDRQVLREDTRHSFKDVIFVTFHRSYPYNYYNLLLYCQWGRDRAKNSTVLLKYLSHFNNDDSVPYLICMPENRTLPQEGQLYTCTIILHFYKSTNVNLQILLCSLSAKKEDVISKNVPNSNDSIQIKLLNVHQK